MSARIIRTPAAVVALVGVLTLVTGMFLPWFRSGTVLRDSFQVVGLVRTLGFLRGNVPEWPLFLWFAVIPLAAVSVAAYALRFSRTAAAIVMVVAIMTGTVSGAATVESGGGDTPLGIASTGPLVTLIGSVLALVGAVGIVIGGRVRARGNAGGEP